jgi:hypothetical protein
VWELSINPPVQKEGEENIPPPHQPYANPPTVDTGDHKEQSGKLNGDPPAIFDGD